MNTKDFLKKLWNDERGQSTTEYILILSVVVMIAIKFKQKFATQIDGITDNLTNQIQSNITTQ